VNTFGKHSISKIPLVYTETQPFDVYNKISRNYTHSFLFESLEGPDELAETSIMGFDPELIVKGYFDKITIQNRDGKTETIHTDTPLEEIKKLIKKILINKKIGNSALEGATKLLLSYKLRKNLLNYVTKIDHLELETKEEFFDYFVEGCQFKEISV